MSLETLQLQLHKSSETTATRPKSLHNVNGKTGKIKDFDKSVFSVDEKMTLLVAKSFGTWLHAWFYTILSF